MQLAEIDIEAEAKAQARADKRKHKARKITPRDPIAVSITEALRLVPVGKTTLFAMVKDGTIKSRKTGGVRAIDYASLKAAFAAPTEEETP